MKIYLDDVRYDCSSGWVLVKTAGEAIAWLKTGVVEEISLDHDLGDTLTGLDVLNWIERKVFEDGFKPPKMYVHSMNPVGRKNMLVAIASIEKRMREG